MNKNTEYEKLTQQLYQALIDAEGKITTEVKHNIILNGRATNHQIDVYWEYEVAGIKHRVAIECKNYNKPVSKSIIKSFHSTLDDIGNIQGILVTTVGFQSGAKEFAEHYGINLYVLRQPQDEDWEGRLRGIDIDIYMISKNVTNTKVLLDEKWVKENISNIQSIEGVFTRMNNETWIVDSDSNPIKNFLQLYDELPVEDENKINVEHIYSFENAFLLLDNVGKVKVNNVVFTYDVITGKPHSLSIDGKDFAKAILKDAISGNIKFFQNDGTIK